MIDLPAGWEARGKPPTLFRRFGFGRYGETRAFLEAIAVLSESLKRHPQNINFGATYVNVTLEALGGEVGAPDAEFARAIDALPASGRT